MPKFDRYIAVDWSAHNGPKSGKDSIWIGEAVREPGSVTLVASENPRTRTEASDLLVARILAARDAGHRILVGFDFPFGYPAGAAQRLTGKADWRQLWQDLADRVRDDARNVSNRFEVAAALNRSLQPAGALFWGHPAGRSYDDLAPTRTGLAYADIAEKRLVERRGKAKSVWQLNGAGSVGGQALLGIPRVRALRSSPIFVDEAAIWPFETDFERNLAPITLAEIYPSLFQLDGTVLPRDRAQVEAVVCAFADLDAGDRLAELMSAPADLSPADRATALREEGWIVGEGHQALRDSASIRPTTPPSHRAPDSYIRDPNAIYAESFATIAREADLADVPAPLQPVLVRMIHACGMVDLAEDFRAEPAVVEAVQDALRRGKSVFCDCEMVKAGIIARFLPQQNKTISMIGDAAATPMARMLGTTRSAAAVNLHARQMAGAVVVIGNAPTALFQLLELLAEGKAKPAAIIATPVGFVGAAESKQLLAAQSFGVPFVTLLGRRGGSAIAAAAFNAITQGMTKP